MPGDDATAVSRAGEGPVAAAIVTTSASNDDTSVSYSLRYSGTHTFFRAYLAAVP